jgi:hypothetical protein
MMVSRENLITNIYERQRNIFTRKVFEKKFVDSSLMFISNAELIRCPSI